MKSNFRLWDTILWWISESFWTICVVLRILTKIEHSFYYKFNLIYNQKLLCSLEEKKEEYLRLLGELLYREDHIYLQNIMDFVGNQ